MNQQCNVDSTCYTYSFFLVPVTFQVQYWIGWKPDPSQPKPLKPNQSADISLKDIYKLDEVVSQKMGEKGFILPGMVTKSFRSFFI